MANHHLTNGSDHYRNSESSGLQIYTEGGLPVSDFQKSFYEWQETEEIHLRDYLDVIVRRKWLIIAVLMLVFLSTLIFTLSSTKIYEASAVIEVSQEIPQVTKFEEVLSSEVGWGFNDTQVELIRSKSMIERVIKKLNLMEHPVLAKILFGDGSPGMVQRAKKFIKSLLPGYKKNDGASAIHGDVLKAQRMLGYISGNLSVSPSRKSMLITVTFSSPDRKFSMSVANTLVEEFIGWKMEKKLEASGAARKFLMMQIDRAKINLEKAEEDLNRFAKKAGIVSQDTKINSIYRHLEELNAVFAESEADLIAKKAIYDQAVNDGPANLPRVLESSLISNLKDKYAELSFKYEDLKTTFQDDYPKVRKLKASMASIASRINAEEEKIFLAIKNEYQAAQKNVDAMKKRIEQQKSLVLDLNDRVTQYSIMAREVNTNKEIYQSLLQRAKEIESMAGLSATNIQIVSRADTPIFPVKPNVKINLLLAIMVGLLGGLGCAFLVEYFADTINNPDEIPDRFHIPLLGLVPQVKLDENDLSSTFLRFPRSSFSEAIRSSRVSVQLSGTGNHSKSILVTSTMPEEGKTTISLNLALSFAAAGEKTVLVDVDLRKPKIEEIFNLQKQVNGNGLSSFLAGVTSKVRSFNGLHKNLRVIPSGAVPPNPAELLASKRFKFLLKDLIGRYDRVVLDGPPHIGFADILILSKSVGGTVLVASIGQTSRAAIGQFKKAMTNINGTILGCIVNKVNFNKNFGYGSYYKSYHAYRKYGLDEPDRKKLTI
jgi:capsular exopolysaccharide synthesis family protein